MADAAKVTVDVEDGPRAAAASKRKRGLTILGVVVLVAALLYGAYYLLFRQGLVHTDNAYVGADTAQITPLVTGAIKELPVSNTQEVKAGAVLLVIDDADARVEVAEAEAALRQAQQRFGQAAATVQAAQGRLSAQGAAIGQARAQLSEAQAAVARAQGEYRRRAALAGSGAVSGEELASARAALQQAQAAREAAGAAIAAAEAQRAAAAGEVAASAAVVRGNTASTAPDVAAARARLDAARLALARTVIRAPVSGVVTNKQVQVGQRVQAGTAVMTIVPTDRVFVDANFKESQFRRLRPGQPVELTSDFYGSDVVFRGRVVGLAGGTGAAFSVIPAQNATGNWIKVVQRLPVRIALDPAQIRAHPLRVGLTMDATVDTRGLK